MPLVHAQYHDYLTNSRGIALSLRNSGILHCCLLDNPWHYNTPPPLPVHATNSRKHVDSIDIFLMSLYIIGTTPWIRDTICAKPQMTNDKELFNGCTSMIRFIYFSKLLDCFFFKDTCWWAGGGHQIGKFPIALSRIGESGRVPFVLQPKTIPTQRFISATRIKGPRLEYTSPSRLRWVAKESGSRHPPYPTLPSIPRQVCKLTIVPPNPDRH